MSGARVAFPEHRRTGVAGSRVLSCCPVVEAEYRGTPSPTRAAPFRSLLAERPALPRRPPVPARLPTPPPALSAPPALRSASVGGRRQGEEVARNLNWTNAPQLLEPARALIVSPPPPRSLSPPRPHERSRRLYSPEPSACLTPQHAAARASQRQEMQQRRQQHQSPAQRAASNQDAHRSPSSCSRSRIPSSETVGERRDETQHAFFVSVFVRLTPPGRRERGEPSCVRTDGTTICVKEVAGTREHQFSFEGVIDSSGGSRDQAKVFEAIGSRMMRSIFDGFHTCVFALGQTGTGKTHTMIGNIEEPGLLPWALRQMLASKSPTETSGSFSPRGCKLSCSELHMDRLHDLLADDPPERHGLDIRCHPQSGVSVPNLTEVVVEDVLVAMRLIHLACRRRSVTQTIMNATSSRGHAIFQVVSQSGTKLCIVDLAGKENERASQCRGQSLAELGYINKSLFHLTSVIQALARPNLGILVPFRNSKLTLLLSESLQCARTFLLATASPAASSFDDTVATLRLAQSVRQIMTKARCEHLQEVPRPLLHSGGDSSSQPEAPQEEEILPETPIPFAPRLSLFEAQNLRRAESEIEGSDDCPRPVKCRLEAWQQSSPGASCAPTEMGDSDTSLEESQSSLYDTDGISLAGEVVEAQRIQQLPWELW